MTTLGIDLGTSNSLIGVWKNDDVQLIPNVFGELLTPSVVSVDSNGELLVGKIAKERLITHPHSTAATFKRFMGTKKMYQLNSNVAFTAVELSAILLSSLKHDAEAYLEEECEEAIISVPAYFNDLQRSDTVTAAKLAGLKTISLISEPTAAALTYNRDVNEDCTVMVVDLGGGTYDVSLLDMFNGIVQVNGVAGDNYFGGEDFTHALEEDFLAKNDLRRTELSVTDQATLNKNLEQIKIQGRLGKKNVIRIGGKEFEYTLSEKEEEEIWLPLLNRLRPPIMNVLKDTKREVEEIDKVILIGGGTTLRSVRNVIGRLLKQIPYTKVNPDTAVAIGTSILTALKNKEIPLKETILIDVCSFTMGIDVVMDIDGILQSGYFSPIIERNSPIPVSKVSNYTTVEEDQSEVLIEIYQGENMLVDDNFKIGQLSIKTPKGKVGQPISVRFTYDINGILEVEASFPETNETQKLIIKNDHTILTDEEIEESFQKLNYLKIPPRDQADNRLLLARINRLYMEADEEERLFLMKIRTDFEAVLNTQNYHYIEKKRTEIIEMVDFIEKELS